MSDSFDDLSRKLHQAGTFVVFGAAPDGGSGFGLDVVRRLIVRSLSMQLESSLRGGVLRMGRWFAEGFGGGGNFFKAQMVGMHSVVNPVNVYFPVALDESVPEDILPLLQGAQRLLTKCKSGYRSLTSVAMLKTTAESPFFVVVAKVESLMMRPPAGASRESRQAMEVAVNRDHPRFQEIFEVYQHEPEMGTYLLAKALLLEEDRLLDLDSKLMEEALRSTVRAFHPTQNRVKS